MIFPLPSAISIRHPRTLSQSTSRGRVAHPFLPALLTPSSAHCVPTPNCQSSVGLSRHSVRFLQLFFSHSLLLAAAQARRALSVPSVSAFRSQRDSFSAILQRFRVLLQPPGGQDYPPHIKLNTKHLCSMVARMTG